MGSSTSKAASTASKASKAASLSANNTARKYPTRSPIATSNRTNVQSPRPNSGAPGPQVHSEMRAVGSRDRGLFAFLLSGFLQFLVKSGKGISMQLDYSHGRGE